MEQLKDMQELTSKINQGSSIVLFFTATWCSDCRFIKPQMPTIEKDFPEFEFINVDRDQFLDFSKELGIMGIPSFVVFKGGEEVGRLVNKDRKTKEEVENFLKTVA